MANRKEIKELWNEALEQFDKQLIFLSSGALVLSMGFVKDIVKITPTTDTSHLVCAWILFACSLVCNLLSYRSSFYAMHFELKNYHKTSDVFDYFTEGLNWLSFLTLIVGIVKFILFINQNLSNG